MEAGVEVMETTVLLLILLEDEEVVVDFPMVVVEDAADVVESRMRSP